MSPFSLFPLDRRQSRAYHKSTVYFYDKVRDVQIPKEEIRSGILEAARAEFLENGFERASIRTVAARAKTSKSNVYNYFQNKDALFRAVAQPALSAMEEGFAGIAQANRQKREGSYTMEAQQRMIALFMRFAARYYRELRLLFFRAAGSSMAGFRESVTRTLAGLLTQWLTAEAPGKVPSAFFVRSVAGFYVGTVERAIAEGAAPDEGTMRDFLNFVYGGWKAVMQ